MPETILVVDDQASVRHLLQEYLSEQGFRVLGAGDGQAALNTIREDEPDLILLDVMMPTMDGFQFLRQYRPGHQTPVIMLTAREEEADTILGLSLGADDYLTKPFRMGELLARIRAVMRRTGPRSEGGHVLRVEDIELDETAHLVSAHGEKVELTRIEFNLLQTLMHSPGQVFSRAQLEGILLQSGFSGLDHTLTVHIRNLRTKIEPDPNNPVYIETVFGVGYRLRKPAQS